MGDSRQQFEAWAEDYTSHNSLKSMLFDAWQASRACPEVELPNTHFIYDIRYDTTYAVFKKDELIAALKAAGIKVKP